MNGRRIAGLCALSAQEAPALRSVLAIGNFDGVHLGHQAVVGAAARQARVTGSPCYVLTFDPSPAEVLGKRRPLRLTSLGRKVELLCAVDPNVSVIVEPFTLELSRLSAEEFVRDLLVGVVRPSLVLVGRNFCFGHEREGDLDLLERLGARYGFEARAEAMYGDRAGPYSSSRVRALIEAGDLDGARIILGRPHAVSGPVVSGAERGRTLGFPTANLHPTDEVLPPYGVYACLVDLEGAPGLPATRLAQGVMNLGIRPTVGAGLSFEVHLLDYAGDLYGKRLRVHLIRPLRGEQRFADLRGLQEQILRDCEEARAALGQETPSLAAGGPWY